MMRRSFEDYLAGIEEVMTPRSICTNSTRCANHNQLQDRDCSAEMQQRFNSHWNPDWYRSLYFVNWLCLSCGAHDARLADRNAA
jgi:ribosomal protein S18 acetylase RimI-like enzyme